MSYILGFFVVFFNDTATTEIYTYGHTLSLHDALPIYIRDARAVADRLGFAHHVHDHESRFRDTVIDQFADEYLNGRTPIPCVRCNMGVKFTDLFALAKDLGADCLATGHYVRRSEEHTSELQSLMRTSYAVLGLKTKKDYNKKTP